jgi:hypothetical protein
LSPVVTVEGIGYYTDALDLLRPDHPARREAARVDPATWDDRGPDMKPGPHNQIAQTLAEQLTRALAPRPPADRDPGPAAEVWQLRMEFETLTASLVADVAGIRREIEELAAAVAAMEAA